MQVASLPDTISISINPLTADCTANDPPIVRVTAIIPNVTEGYKYWWNYNGIDQVKASTGKTEKTNLQLQGAKPLSFNSPFSCKMHVHLLTILMLTSFFLKNFY